MSFRKDWLDRWATYAPIKMAVKDGQTGEDYSYRQLNNLSNKIAHHLSEEGVVMGDRIAVLAEFSIEYVALVGAAMKLGVIIVPLNYRLSEREVAFMINNCRPKLLLVESKFKNLVNDDLLETRTDVFKMDDWVRELKEGMDEEQQFQALPIQDDHPLFIIYTSGTTGFPKGALYTHKMAFWNATNTILRLDISSNDHTIICMPPFHTGGWNVLLIPFLLQGASFTLLNKFEPETILPLLDQEEATVFMGVPTMLKMMSESLAFRQSSLEAMRFFIVGGEAMPIALIRTWEKKGIPIRQGYGLTEVGPNVTSLHHDDAIRKIGSIGTPNFFVETKIVNQDSQEVGPDEEGELWLKGPVVTPGYWENEEATNQSFHEGWFKTGDILVKDEEGYFFVKDRIKNMFISGGENVYPAEVEKQLQMHPLINEVAVLGVAHEKWGEVGKAIIVCVDQPPSEKELVHYCSDKLAKYKIPKHFEFVEEIPKTDSGKIDRNRLVALFG